MTAPRAAIVFNASTGSDTAASGLGPATAISGTAAAHTGGSASTTITLTGSPDLSGVQAGDLLWLKTASGRQFSVIASADNSAKTVTVDDSFTIAEASAVNYAIGGKRATWDDADSRTLFGANGFKAGWTIQTETDQSLSSPIALGASGTGANHIIIEGVGDTRPVVTQTASGTTQYCFSSAGSSAAYFSIKHLQFKQSGATKAPSISITAVGITPFLIRDCIFGDASGGNNPSSGIRFTDNSNASQVIDCEFRYCTSTGIIAYRGVTVIRNCSIHHCGADGIWAADFANNGRFVVDGCLIWANSGDGIYLVSGGAFYQLTGNTIHGNTGDGIQIASSSWQCTILNNQLTANGGYGIALDGQSNAVVIEGNNFGTGATANTSGTISHGALAASNLSVDPQYTDAANGDFSVGTNVQAKGFPDATRYIGANQSATRSYVDIGAAQRQEHYPLPGIAYGPLTLAKESGANARGGSGTCAKLTPASTTVDGYWHFYVPATASTAFTLSFYFAKSAANFNGTLKVTIFDTDQTTKALDAQSVDLSAADTSYHQHTCTQVTPTATGMCLVRIEVRNGSNTGSIYVDDIAIG